MKIMLPSKFIAAGLLSLIISVEDSFAQFNLVVGPKGGVAVTSFSGDGAGNVTTRTTGLGGLFLNAQFGEVFNVQPEFLIGQRGGTITNENTTNNFSLSYFDVPVLLKFRLPVDKVFYPHVLLGPDFAFNTNTKVTSSDTQTGTEVAVSGGQFNQSDIGALAGAGIDFQSKRIFVTLDARYGYSFNDVGTSNSSVALNFRNTGWSFTAGVGIRLFNND